MSRDTASKAHKRQLDYVSGLPGEEGKLDLIVAQAFVRSIRDLGYRSAATALDELIDNSIEAGAANVHVALGFNGKSDAKPTQIAVLDDGFGMVPGMVAASAQWGGTDREGSRNLFGRYGYGLPSASVSQGKRFSVLSRIDSGTFYGVTLDVEEIGKAKTGSRVLMPEAATQELPQWIQMHAEEAFPGGMDAVRTVIVWDKLDRITWKTASSLEQNLLQHFGLVYRGFLRQTAISVNRKVVEPIDPLFITPGYRLYDVDDDRAEALPPLALEVPDDNGKLLGTVTLRISYMPPGFLSKDKSKKATGKNQNARFGVRKDNNGFIICRNGRQIDTVTKNKLTTFVNNDRYIGLELDFPAALDEEFGVTTAKQQITISDRVLDRLQQAGFLRIMEQLRKRVKEEVADTVTTIEGSDSVASASEAVMAEVSDLVRQRPPSPEAEEIARENLDREIERVAKEEGLPEALVRDAHEEAAAARPFRVHRESVADAPFYRVEQRGGQFILILNTAHRFFTDVYAVVEGLEGARIRASLDLLLFILGQCELDANTQGQIWYQSERIEWSRRLNAALTLLEDHLDLLIDEPDTLLDSE
ncbi:MAG TPA: ATP-binding protein [Acidimicrobiales bacterium]|jgi:hypothetical protein|nr:ATP-binding protein [Acidimicrobiales bacterium]